MIRETEIKNVTHLWFVALFVCIHVNEKAVLFSSRISIERFSPLVNLNNSIAVLYNVDIHWYY